MSEPIVDEPREHATTTEQAFRDTIKRQLRMSSPILRTQDAGASAVEENTNINAQPSSLSRFFSNPQLLLTGSSVFLISYLLMAWINPPFVQKKDSKYRNHFKIFVYSLLAAGILVSLYALAYWRGKA